ncbi:MATE family efflux transporter [Endozoicomonas sp. SM1973]|uniref:Multidrug-efflux transporter n=1 Tax=Spartinivicinus marinus TaxID=2994442 RepID=A0A853I995_9GAMM|nr:MATE family efflux transporter [Spartinivicinus marinus]MCX4027161.1 MATE family efflux transporter [Spartinivicinus marinus]NYZ66117.1 MATE family efflux transporter [Spartinivicinus marinus]
MKQLSVFSKQAKALSTLAWPIILSQVALVALGLTDTIMMGILGKEALAGGGLGVTITGLLLTLALGVLGATSNLIAPCAHKTPDGTVKQYSYASLIVATGFGVLILLVLFWARELINLTGQSEVTTELADQYLQGFFWGVLPGLWFQALRFTVMPLGHTRVVTIIAWIDVLLNIPINYLLITGSFGFPNLGIKGIGVATSVVHITSFILLVAYILYHPKLAEQRNAFIGKLRLGFYCKETLKLGIPQGITYLAEVGLFSTTAFMMGLFGNDTLAAHQITIQTITVPFMVAMGIAQATGIKVGHELGHNNIQACRQYGWLGLGMGACLMLVAALAFWLFPEVIVGLYLDKNNPENQQVFLIASQLLIIAAYFEIFDGSQTIASSALRGLKEAKRPMLLAISSYWLVGLPVALLLGFYWQWQGTGVWWGLAAGLAAAAISLIWLFEKATRVGHTDSGELITNSRIEKYV